MEGCALCCLQDTTHTHDSVFSHLECFHLHLILTCVSGLRWERLPFKALQELWTAITATHIWITYRSLYKRKRCRKSSCADRMARKYVFLIWLILGAIWKRFRSENVKSNTSSRQQSLDKTTYFGVIRHCLLLCILWTSCWTWKGVFRCNLKPFCSFSFEIQAKATWDKHLSYHSSNRNRPMSK